MLITGNNTSPDKCRFGQSQWHKHGGFFQEIERTGLIQCDGDFKLDERMKVGHVTAGREWPIAGRPTNNQAFDWVA